MNKHTSLKIWQIFLPLIFIFVSVHFLKDITQDLMKISTPFDILGDIKEDLSFLPDNLKSVYLYGLGGFSFIFELMLIFFIPKVWKEKKLSKLGKLVIFLFVYLMLFFLFAIWLDPRYNTNIRNFF